MDCNKRRSPSRTRLDQHGFQNGYKYADQTKAKKRLTEADETTHGLVATTWTGKKTKPRPDQPGLVSLVSLNQRRPKVQRLTKNN